LVAYDFEIADYTGSQNGKLNARSRHPVYHSENGSSADQPTKPILSIIYFSLNKEEKKYLISASKLSKRWVNRNKEFLEPVKIDGKKDKKYQKELEILRMEK
jgi:hypothetical protein